MSGLLFKLQELQVTKSVTDASNLKVLLKMYLDKNLISFDVYNIVMQNINEIVTEQVDK